MKKGYVSKLVAMMLMAIMLMSVAGCGVSVGTPSNNENNEFSEVFPDASAKDGNAYVHTDIAYNFSLQEYGQMKVYVDTTNKHEFELISEEAGFHINDADGNTVVYAACLNDEAYKALTAPIDTVKTINGRDFFIRENGDGSVDAFSYMADCGLNAGLVMEVKENPENFSLVAFRGDAIEGSSSDPYFYKGTDESAINDLVEPEDDPSVSTPEEDGNVDLDTTKGEYTTSTLNNEAQGTIDSLETDFSKIYWGVTYPVSEDIPGFVISVTPYTDYGQNYLIVGLTNLYDKEMDFSASVGAYDKDNNIIGDSFFYERNIGSGNTVTEKISCDGNPDGRLHWEDLKLDFSDDYRKYVAWEADYSAKGSSSGLELDYEFYSSNNEDMKDVAINFYALDKNGFIIGEKLEYISEEIPAGEKYSGSCTMYMDEELLPNVAGLAMFSNPVSEVE